MTESEFNQKVDDTLIRIEDAIEDSGADIDYESAGGILTLTFEDDSQIILNRQAPVQQIWIAARGGGFHFDYNTDADQWQLAGKDTELFAALSEYCSQQAGSAVELSGLG